MFFLALQLLGSRTLYPSHPHSLLGEHMVHPDVPSELNPFLFSDCEMLQKGTAARCSLQGTAVPEPAGFHERRLSRCIWQ